MREVVRRAVWQAQLQLVGRRGRIVLAADLARRPAVGFEERGVEAAQARVAGGRRNRRDRQRRFGQELFREQQAPRRSDFERARAELLGEKPAQVPLADADPARKLGQRSRVERALLDQAQRTGDELALRAVQRRSGRRFRTAAQARPKTCGRCRGGAGVIADVARLGRRRGTDGPAIDPRRRDGDEEEPVEARIARLAGAIAYAAVERGKRYGWVHGAILRRTVSLTSRFRLSMDLPSPACGERAKGRIRPLTCTGLGSTNAPLRIRSAETRRRRRRIRR